MATPFGVKFGDYARYGVHFQSGDQKYIDIDGPYNGTSVIGRLGNEDSSGEFQLSKTFKSDNSAIWDINVMIDHWGDEVNLRKAYTGVASVLESSPNAHIWASCDFHQRPQQGINDYFRMNHDGQDAGVRSFDIDGVQLDIAVVTTVESRNSKVVENEANPSCTTCIGGSGTGNKGNCAVASKIHNMKVGPLDLKIYTNYGLDFKAAGSDDRPEAWQGIFVLSHTNDSGVNKVIACYSDNPDNGVCNKINDPTTVCASLEGSHRFTRQAQVEYLLALHDYDNSTDKSDNRKNCGAIARPMYFWNDVHSIQLEAGYQRVDYDNGGDDHDWKLAPSQNMSVAMGPEFRPMLRFYVTGGRADNDRTVQVSSTRDGALGDFNLGAVWKA